MLNAPNTIEIAKDVDLTNPAVIHAQNIHSALVESLASTEYALPYSRTWGGFKKLAVVSRFITESAIDIKTGRPHVAQSRLQAAHQTAEFARPSLDTIQQSRLSLQEMLIDAVQSPINLHTKRAQYYATIMSQLALATQGVINSTGEQQLDWFGYVQELCPQALVYRKQSAQLLSIPSPTHHDGRKNNANQNYDFLFLATANIDSGDELSMTRCKKIQVKSSERPHSYDDSIEVIYANSLLGHRAVPTIEIPTAMRLLCDYLDDIELHPLQQEQLELTSKKVLAELLK